MALDHYYLNLAYHLALQNEGSTAPNPSVGAVVVCGEQVVSYGYHARAGEAHAEVMALQQAGERARNATLYCTLEPCAHQGKTPPCVDAISSAGVTRVFFGVKDLNPLVNGKGETLLRQRGIQVEQIRQSVIEKFYDPFFFTLQSSRPYVIAKVAM